MGRRLRHGGRRASRGTPQHACVLRPGAPVECMTVIYWRAGARTVERAVTYAALAPMRTDSRYRGFWKGRAYR